MLKKSVVYCCWIIVCEINSYPAPVLHLSEVFNVDDRTAPLFARSFCEQWARFCFWFPAFPLLHFVYTRACIGIWPE